MKFSPCDVPTAPAHRCTAQWIRRRRTSLSRPLPPREHVVWSRARSQAPRCFFPTLSVHVCRTAESMQRLTLRPTFRRTLLARAGLCITNKPPLGGELLLHQKSPSEVSLSALLQGVHVMLIDRSPGDVWGLLTCSALPVGLLEGSTDHGTLLSRRKHS